MKFYSNSTKLCYDDNINSDIPEDSVSITEEVFMEILELRSLNAEFMVDDSGNLVDVVVVDNTQEIERQKRLSEASAYLFSTDWYIIRMMETGKQVPDYVAQKRIECREILSDERLVG